MSARVAAAGEKKYTGISAAHNERLLEGEITQFALDMKKLINQKDTADVKFMIGHNKKNIYAHKAILSARSEVLRAMFADKMGTGSGDKSGVPSITVATRPEDVPIVIPNITSDVFLAMLEFIYTNCVTLNSKIALPVLGCAVEYGLEEMKKLTVRYIVKYLDTSNVCEALQAAVNYSQTDLKDKCMQFIENDTSSVLKSKAFTEVNENALGVILQSDELNIDEMELIGYVRNWAQVNAQVTQKPVAQLAVKAIRMVRLGLLGPDELTKLEQENDDAFIPVDLLSNAWKMHALKRADKNNPQNKRRQGTILRDSHKMLELV